LKGGGRRRNKTGSYQNFNGLHPAQLLSRVKLPESALLSRPMRKILNGVRGGRKRKGRRQTSKDWPGPNRKGEAKVLA